MKRNNPAGRPGCGSGIDEKSDRQIIPLIRPRPNRPGILTYRQQRSHAEFFRAIRDALNREATLREQSGTPDPWLRDTADWVGRGCLP